MARTIRPRSAGRTRWWSSLIVGAAVGAVAAWVVLRGMGGDEAAEPTDPPRPRGAPREPDLDAMAARLRSVPGAQELRLRSLGGGILELVGSATAELDVPALLHALASQPHVSVVVNRVWTPNSRAGDPFPLDVPGPADPSASTPSAP
jgi:hypothetical protein